MVTGQSYKDWPACSHQGDECYRRGGRGNKTGNQRPEKGQCDPVTNITELLSEKNVSTCTVFVELKLITR